MPQGAAVCCFVLLYLFIRGHIMTDIIYNYTHSCELVKQRINELLALRHKLLEGGDPLRAKELDLDRRIRILYQEQNELTEIIAHLTSYRRRLEERAEA